MLTFQNIQITNSDPTKISKFGISSVAPEMAPTPISYVKEVVRC